MKTFTRFELQQILTMAVRNKNQLKKLRESDNFHVDTNIDTHISTLEDIIFKTKFNMGEFDKTEK